MLKEPRGQKLINRYKQNYHIGQNVEITEEMILTHWELEKYLTHKLLISTPENRRRIFAECYSKLYRELTWLNDYVDTSRKKSTDRYRNWINLIGKPPARIYEIGSGKGDLIRYLADCGYQCRGTEITVERGSSYFANCSNISWGFSDGIHLDQFEPLNSYDVVISSQVIEHLHPDDIVDHFKGVFSILQSGGKYILDTPHRYFGPSDVSRIFGYAEAQGMHLKEYNYHEIRSALKEAEFTRIYAVIRFPILFGHLFSARKSTRYLDYLLVVENGISPFAVPRLNPIIAIIAKCIFFRTIFLVAEK